MSRYQERGVSNQKEDVHNAIKHLDKGLFPMAFCKILPDYLTNDEEHCIVMHSDGAGTKSSLGYAYYKKLLETGVDESVALEVWNGIAQDSVVMNLDDLICVGAVNSQFLLSSTINRNKNLVDGKVIASLIRGTETFIGKMRKHGINIVSSGGETADVPDLVRTVCVDSTMFCRIKRSEVIDLSNIEADDVIVGLSSFGKCTYEDEEYNSGIGSNGLTSARHDMFGKSVKESFPECYDTNLPDNVVFVGKHSLLDKISVVHEEKSIEMDAAKFVLSPTRSYAPIIAKVLNDKNIRESVHGIIHCSGGGQTKIQHFLKGSNSKLKVVKDNLFPIPKLFSLIQEQSKTEWKEMYAVFNMGHRMEIYCKASVADAIIKASESFQVKARIVGKVLLKNSLTEPNLEIKSQVGSFLYHA